ncbi:MAG: hypothetical protein E7645_08545 [Ruminococcaceae bacterium]|nr:hypothetical protein [Oscillospiraceae bacterium]
MTKIPKYKYPHTSHRKLRWVPLLLLLTIGMTFLTFPFFGAAADTISQSVDFSDPDGIDVLIPAGELLTELLGDIPPAEVDYLNIHSSYVFYTSEIPANRMTARVTEDGIIVSANDYTYTTDDGVTVTWMPLFAENLSSFSELYFLFYDESLDLFQATLPGKSGDQINVYYTASFTLPEEFVVGLINEGPLAAADLLVAAEAYEEELAIFTEQKELYEAYVAAHKAWQANTKAYEAYVIAKAAYDAWWADHDLKKAAMDAYLEKKAAYDAWIKYQQDLEDYEAYLELVYASPELKAEYMEKMDAVQSHLAVMDRMFIRSSTGHSFKSVLTGGAADLVINNQFSLKNIDGVNPADVDLAVKSTWTLRHLIQGNDTYPGYENQKTEADKYHYYIAYRGVFLENIANLYHSMSALSSIEYVMKQIDENNGRDVFVQFLGTLYLQMCLMDDTQDFDPQTSLHGVTVDELLESHLMLPDENHAEPLTEYPQPPTTSDDVTPVPHPGYPPAEAPHPGEAPEAVPDESQAPTCPEEVFPAGNEPEAVPAPGEAPQDPKDNMLPEELALLSYAQSQGLPMRSAQDLPTGHVCTLSLTRRIKAGTGRVFMVTVMDYLGQPDYTDYLYFGDSPDILTPPSVAPHDPHMVFAGWSLTPVETMWGS